jgi:hypothetical protein
VLDAVVTSQTQPVPLRLAPMGQPHPGAGQFYLDQQKAVSSRKGHDETRPIARWGESPDHPVLRQMRGRKLYWRTEVDGGRQRGKARVANTHAGHTGSPDQFVTQVEVLPTGTTLHVVLVFDNMSPEEIGGVIAALAPDRFLRAAGHATQASGRCLLSVGGGKPFGFGSVDVSDLTVDMQTAASRYQRSAPPEPAPVEDLLAAFIGSVDTDTRAVWPQVAAATEFARVDDRLVWYPPGQRWPDSSVNPQHPHAGLTDQHDRGFAFWNRSAGHVNVDQDRGGLVPLPCVLDRDQTLGIEE